MLIDTDKCQVLGGNGRIPRCSAWVFSVLVNCPGTLFLFLFLTLQYCIGFAIHQHKSPMGVHVFPILNPCSYLPPHAIPLGHPSAPAPSIQYHACNLDWRFVSYMILYVSMTFSQIIPPSPSPTESKRLFFPSVSPLLSCR